MRGGEGGDGKRTPITSEARAQVHPDGIGPGGSQVIQTVLRMFASGSICPRLLRKSPGPFASDPVCMRLFGGVCAQADPKLRRSWSDVRYQLCCSVWPGPRLGCA
jgi:hypothetical protein